MKSLFALVVTLIAASSAIDQGLCGCYCGSNPMVDPPLIGTFEDNFCLGCNSGACSNKFSTCSSAAIIHTDCSQKYFWFSGSWSECQKNCNATRDVFCEFNNGNKKMVLKGYGNGTKVNLEVCEPIQAKKPNSTQVCYGDQCKSSGYCNCFCNNEFVGRFEDKACEDCSTSTCLKHFPSKCEHSPSSSSACVTPTNPTGIIIAIVMIVLVLLGIGGGIGFYIWWRKKKAYTQLSSSTSNETSHLVSNTTPSQP